MFSTLFSSTAALLALAAIPATLAVDIPVVVGGVGILKYTPDSVTANPGDRIVFTFHQKNHTATQSSLANPCTPLAGGFDSGFVPVAATNTNGPFQSAVFTVQDTKPVWVFCRQAGHCQAGMVFAVNPGSNLAAFQAAATGSASSASAAPPAASAAPGATGTNHQVVVGGTGILAFTPSNITAQAGDTITFQFQQKNHTATQSSFASPCQPLASTSTTGQVGFDSGFMPVAANSTTFPTWTITVNNTTPIWVYCRQTGHCSQGMVFAANAPATGNTFDAYLANAKGAAGSAAATAAGNPTSAASPTGAAASSASSLTTGGPWSVVLAMLGVVAGMVL